MAPGSSRKAPAYREIFRGIDRSRYAFFRRSERSKKFDLFLAPSGRGSNRASLGNPGLRPREPSLSSPSPSTPPRVVNVVLIVDRVRSILPTIAAGISLDEASSRNFLSLSPLLRRYRSSLRHLEKREQATSSWNLTISRYTYTRSDVRQPTSRENICLVSNFEAS